MELAYAFLADSAQFTPDGKLNMLGGDFDSIGADTFPHIHIVMAVVMRFSLQPEEATVEHPVSIQVRSLDRPDDPPISQINGAFAAVPVLPDDGKPLFVANSSQFAMLEFPSQGRYIVRIIVDGSVVKDLSLLVGPR
jgi:hypothetical protein